MEISLIERTRWAYVCANRVQSSVLNSIAENGCCNLVLTGGRSAKLLYEVWGRNPEFGLLKNVNFYFGDERCVPLTHPDSNYGMTLKTLFRNGIPNNCRLIPIMDQNGNCRNLPEVIDVLLLGVGDDGHIASIFPKSYVLSEECNSIFRVRKNGDLYDRLTIGPRTLKDARVIYMLGFGHAKQDVLNEALLNPADHMQMPIRLVLDSIWLLST